MIYAETGLHPMSIAVQKSVIKYWLKVIQCEKKRLISIIYCKMEETMCCWVCHVNDICVASLQKGPHVAKIKKLRFLLILLEQVMTNLLKKNECSSTNIYEVMVDLRTT